MSEQGVLRLSLPPGWRPLRGWVLLVVALAVLNVLTYMGLTRPRWFDVTAQSRALEAARQARQLLEPALAEARANYGLVLQAETDLEELHNRIAASGTSVSSVIENLEERLQAVGMRFDRGTYAQERIDELDLLLLQMTVPLSGRYSAVRELVESLAAGDGFMAIDQVGLASPDQTESGGSLQVELQLAAFLPAAVSSLPSASQDEPATEAEAGAEANAPAGDIGDIATGEALEAEMGEETIAVEETEVAAGPPRARPASDISPVLRAGELQAQLASLPPLPYPPEAYDVRLGDLDVSREVPETPDRNLFDYRRPPIPAAQALPVPGAGLGGEEGEGAEPGQATTSGPAIPLRLLGIVRVGAIWYASMTDGTDLHVATAGATLPGGYQVVDVGTNYAEIKLGEQQVRLTLES